MTLDILAEHNLICGYSAQEREFKAIHQESISHQEKVINKK